VAGFIGSPQMNLLETRREGGALHLGSHRLPVDLATGGAEITIGVRPESWTVVGEGAGVPVRIDLVEELGSDSFAYGTADLGDRTATVSVRLANRDAAVVGSTIHVTVAQQSAHLFDSATGVRVSR
jgi:multiple sugar transport system ATP-binding protein